MAINERAYGITLSPRRTRPSEEAELEQEQAELQSIRDKAAREAELHRDFIGELIDAKVCKRNHPYWFIVRNGFPIQTTHFYPEKKIAVDVFEVIGPEQKREIAFKREAFEREGIRYGAIDFYMDVADLLPQIAKVKLWPFSRK